MSPAGHSRSNCLLGAIAIRRRFGGRLDWRAPWGEPGQGWRGFLGNPWGHWRVMMPNGDVLSYSAYNKDISVFRQLWFQGRIKRVKNEGR